MRGKRGFLRILEAFIAAMIILGALSFLYINKIQKPNQEETINELITLTLKNIENNERLRNTILSNNPNGSLIMEEVRKTIPENIYNVDFKICELNSICGMNNYIDKEVFSDEISVSISLNSNNACVNDINGSIKCLDPKKIRIFVWEK